MKVILKNNFHNTAVTVYCKNGGHLSKRQMTRVHNTLCGSPQCTCSNYGVRGLQDYYINLVRINEGNGKYFDAYQICEEEY